MKRLEEVPDGVDSKRLKKRLYQKAAKLRKALKIDEKIDLNRSQGWTEERKAEMREEGKWTRVNKVEGAPNDVDETAVKTMLDARTAAKKIKDYSVADENATNLRAVNVCYDDTTFTWFTKKQKDSDSETPTKPGGSQEKKKKKNKTKTKRDEPEADEDPEPVKKKKKIVDTPVMISGDAMDEIELETAEEKKAKKEKKKKKKRE